MNRPSDPTGPRSSRTIDDVWLDDHRYLHTVAARMLRDASAAEDVVQEAFGRLMSVDVDQIDDTRAWLTVAVRRLCLNRLDSAYQRRESVAGAAPPDDAPQPAATPRSGDPAEQVTLDDQVQRALAVVLERLSPAERTSFVLHDIFGYPYDEIGALVGRSSAACRQLASRARRSVRSSPSTPTAEIEPTPSADPHGHRQLVERFVTACQAGDVSGLLEVLDPDAAGEFVTSDGTVLGHGDGAGRVATNAIRFLGPDSGTILVPVLGERGVDMVARYPNGGRAVLELTAEHGLIRELHGTVTPPSDASPDL